MAILASKIMIPKLSIQDTKSPHNFIPPTKKINEGRDVSTFLTSKAYNDIMAFILQLNTAMFPQCAQDSRDDSQPIELGGSFSGTVQRLRNLLDDLQRIMDDVPPDSGPRRFGNISFRKWFENVESQSLELMERHLPADVLSLGDATEVGALREIESYFLGSFGSPQRLDYGTGHELSFLAFLGCIWKLGGFENTNSGHEERSIVLGVIEPYIQLTRRLIKIYTLEPAGSHGVWGLDDHFFIPYIFGSAQYAPAISSNGEIPTEGSGPDTPNPSDVANIMVVERERAKNMYFGAIGFIYDVKKGPFWEHSPMLYDISGVQKGWAKINKGMLKMYNVEVLSKFPVVQHFKFGSLFSWDQDPDAIPPQKSVHTANQPADKGFSSSSQSNPLMRGAPQALKAPWSTQQPVLPNSNMGASVPWAIKPPDPGTPYAKSLHQDPRQMTQPATSQAGPASRKPTGCGKEPDPQRMPPPTRAP